MSVQPMIRGLARRRYVKSPENGSEMTDAKKLTWTASAVRQLSELLGDPRRTRANSNTVPHVRLDDHDLDAG